MINVFTYQCLAHFLYYMAMAHCCTDRTCDERRFVWLQDSWLLYLCNCSGEKVYIRLGRRGGVSAVFCT